MLNTIERLAPAPLSTWINLWDGGDAVSHAAIACRPGEVRAQLHRELIRPTLLPGGRLAAFTAEIGRDPLAHDFPSIDLVRAIFPLTDEIWLSRGAEFLVAILQDHAEQPTGLDSGAAVELMEQHLLNLAWRHARPSIRDLQAQLKEYGHGPVHAALTPSPAKAHLWTANAALTARRYACEISALLDEHALPCLSPLSERYSPPARGSLNLGALRLQSSLVARCVLASLLFAVAKANADQGGAGQENAILFDQIPDLLNLLPAELLQSAMEHGKATGTAFIFSQRSLLDFNVGPSLRLALSATTCHVSYGQSPAELDFYARAAPMQPRSKVSYHEVAAGAHVSVVRRTPGNRKAAAYPHREAGPRALQRPAAQAPHIGG